MNPLTKRFLLNTFSNCGSFFALRMSRTRLAIERRSACIDLVCKGRVKPWNALNFPSGFCRASFILSLEDGSRSSLFHTIAVLSIHVCNWFSSFCVITSCFFHGALGIAELPSSQNSILWRSVFIYVGLFDEISVWKHGWRFLERCSQSRSSWPSR